ncbi:MAG: T9SS type A sorting domain-containing protein [Weeksellaceae bacterium]|nr:T9SS type A sorting domain-containing protein [Bacteroidota bacterium]MCG2780511.1 T9SS type A sorting domain-containing protein [Weeksellaceae bacterium]
MKKLYVFILMSLFCQQFFAQINLENKGLFEKEIGRYQRMIDFNVNPNTLNYDLKYQRMDVYLDPAVLQISGSVTSHFLAKQDMSGIYFNLTDLLPVSQVVYHGTNLPFQQLSTKELKIDFPASVPANTLDSLTVHYSGVPDNSGRTSFYMGTHNGSPVLATLSEPYGAQNWFPTKQSMNDKIDRFDFKITTPDQYSVASNGKLMSETLLAGSKKLTFWRTQYPMAAYLAAFSIGIFNKTNDVIGSPAFPYVNYIYPDTAVNPDIINNLEWTKTAMSIFENHFGPYPFSAEKYGHMEFAVNGAAMEHQTMSSMNSFAKSTIAHELAHQWFGDKITCGAWNDIWLNEGFATFGEHLMNEKNLMTHTEFMNYLANHVSIITSLPNGSIYVKDSDLGNIATVFSGRLSYIKGGYVLRMVKWILGDDVFYQMLKDYTSNPSFAYNYAKTEDFKNQILTSTGKDFTGFFNDWIYGQGYPSYTIKWNQPIVNQDIKFEVSQIQSDPSVDFFELPLPIKVTGTNGETAYLVLDNTLNNQSFSKPLNFQAANVEFNYEYQIIEKNATVVYDPALAAESVKKDEIILFPNPVKKELYLKGIAKMSDYEIYFVDGKFIKKGKYTLSNSIDVSQLSPGIYFIKINGKNLKFTKK